MANYVPAKLAYLLFEPASAVNEILSPVIFLHGITGTKESWNDIPQTIANGTKRRVFAIDFRDHGDSEYTEIFSNKSIIDDLFHFMDTINAPKVIIIGHSMGSFCGTRAALEKPERIEMVIAVDMYVKKIPGEIFENLFEFANLWITFVQNIPSHLNEKEVVKLAVDYMFDLMPENMLFFVKTKELYNMNVALKRLPDGSYDVRFNKDVILPAIKNGDKTLSETTGQYNGPAFFLYGRRSPFQVYNEEDNIRKHFPKAQLIAFEEASHYLHLEYPKKFTETVLSLLKEH